MLRVEGITVSIGAVTVLRRLSLSVQAGAIVGLVGRNGAGKTTTLRTIMGLTRVDGGQIRLNDHDLSSKSPHARARLGIGYLPEDRRLVGALSVYDNLLIPAQVTWDAAWSERLNRVFALLPEVEQLSGRRAMTLSGGQQKLVALARSFVNGRKLLLLDEPFEGVSTALSRRLARIVAEFQKLEPEAAVLVAESDLKRIGMLTQSALLIERGEVVDELAL